MFSQKQPDENKEEEKPAFKMGKGGLSLKDRMAAMIKKKVLKKAEEIKLEIAEETDPEKQMLLYSKWVDDQKQKEEADRMA
jgi:hypothetical protein